MGTLVESDRALGAALVAVISAAFIALAVLTPRSFQFDKKPWLRLRAVVTLIELLAASATMVLILSTIVPSILLAGAYEEMDDAELESLLFRVFLIIGLVYFLFIIRQLLVPLTELLVVFGPWRKKKRTKANTKPYAKPRPSVTVKELPVHVTRWPAVVSAVVTTAGWLYLIRQNSKKPPTS